MTQLGGYYEFVFGPHDDRRTVRGRVNEALSGERHTYYAFQLDNGVLMALPVGETQGLSEIEDPLPDIS